jgi:hypothetical protein
MIDKICIKPNLLRYIFLMAKKVYADDIYFDEIPNFLVDLTKNIGHIDTTDDSKIMHLIDLAINSALPKN